MSDDVIQKPGFYKQRNGGKAEVLLVKDDFAIGFMASDAGVPHRWRLNGEFQFAINGVQPHDITGPWPPDPPEPPAGFVVQDRDTYKAQKGDKLWNAVLKGYTPVIDSVGKTATQIEQSCRSWSPVFIASPIPKPAVDPGEGWRLLGDEEVVASGDECCDTNNTKRWNPAGIFLGKNAGEKMREYKVNGLMFRRRITAQWTPTDERISLQKFTNGAETDWRVV